MNMVPFHVTNPPGLDEEVTSLGKPTISHTNNFPMWFDSAEKGFVGAFAAFRISASALYSAPFQPAATLPFDRSSTQLVYDLSRSPTETRWTVFGVYDSNMNGFDGLSGLSDGGRTVRTGQSASPNQSHRCLSR
jgi:hypothetical protein